MGYTGKKPTNVVDVSETQSLTVDGDLTVDTTTLKVDSTNNRVGVGTASPTDVFEVNGGTLNGTTYITATNNHSDQFISMGINANVGEIAVDDGDVMTFGHYNNFSAKTYTERMRIDTSGNVGIGTTTPEATLDVMGNSDSVAALKLNGGNDTHGFHFYTRATEGDFLLKREVSGTQTDVMRISRSSGEVGLNQDPVSTVRFAAKGDSNNHAGIFTSLSTGYASVIFENTGSSGDRIFASFRIGNNEKGKISSDGSSTTYATSSDYRLKENVTYTWDATARLKQLKPARFDWIGNPDAGTQDGFLAHEISSIVPNAVVGEKDAVDADGNPEYQNVDPSKLVPLLVKTIQELEARITALEG